MGIIATQEDDTEENIENYPQDHPDRGQENQGKADRSGQLGVASERFTTRNAQFEGAGRPS